MSVREDFSPLILLLGFLENLLALRLGMLGGFLLFGFSVSPGVNGSRFVFFAGVAHGGSMPISLPDGPSSVNPIPLVGTIVCVDPLTPFLMHTNHVPTLEDLIRRPAWQSKAACRGQSLSAFFPERGGNGQAGRALCAGCVVRSACLDYAQSDPELQGIWGGTSPGERKVHRRAS